MNTEKLIDFFDKFLFIFAFFNYFKEKHEVNTRQISSGNIKALEKSRVNFIMEQVTGIEPAS